MAGVLSMLVTSIRCLFDDSEDRDSDSTVFPGDFTLFSFSLILEVYMPLLFGRF